MFHAQLYLERFHVIHDDNVIVNILYDLYLKKFNIPIEDDEYIIVDEYHDKVFDLVEDLRELSFDNISDVLIYLDSVLPSLADIIIMAWCLPRSKNYHSKIMYDKQYKSNIGLYNHKMIYHIELYVVRNFCLESLIKDNYIPVHCIDLLWFWMNNIDIEFAFCNSGSGNHIGIDKSDGTKIIINMENIINLGLGNQNAKNRGTFMDLLQRVLHDEYMVDYYSKIDKNYVTQRDNILR